MTTPTIEQCLAYLDEYIEIMSCIVPPDNNALVFHKFIRARLLAAQEVEKALEQAQRWLCLAHKMADSHLGFDAEGVANDCGQALAAWRNAGKDSK